MFSIIFLRLWYLQVLSGDQYLSRRSDNQVREITVQAPRGEILDRNGKVLVDNRTALALQLSPHGAAHEPGREREALIARLGDVARDDPERRSTARSTSRAKSAPRQPGDAQARRRPRPRSTTCGRTRRRFPGVSVERVFVRNYPTGHARRAHLRLRRRGHRRAAQGAALPGRSSRATSVGQSGIEYTYDSFLRGPNGAHAGPGRRPRAGRRGGLLQHAQPGPGDNLRLTIDSDRPGGRRGGARLVRAARARSWR